MKTQNPTPSSISRRAFLSRSTSAAALAVISPRLLAAESAVAGRPAGKPNSVFNGVRVGCITYSYRGGKINTAEETLDALLQDGISEVELMDGPIRSFTGMRGGRGRRGDGGEPTPAPT